MDETYVRGYQPRRVRRARGTNKTMLFGMVERGGNLRGGPVANAWLTTIEGVVKKAPGRPEQCGG